MKFDWKPMADIKSWQFEHRVLNKLIKVVTVDVTRVCYESIEEKIESNSRYINEYYEEFTIHWLKI